MDEEVDKSESLAEYLNFGKISNFGLLFEEGILTLSEACDEFEYIHLHALQQILINLQQFEKATKIERNNIHSQLKTNSDQLYRISWEMLHTGKWSEVNELWRELFAFSSYILSTLYSYQILIDEKNCLLNHDDSSMENAFYYADLGLIMGGPNSFSSSNIHSLLSVLQQFDEISKNKHFNQNFNNNTKNHAQDKKLTNGKTSQSFENTLIKTIDVEEDLPTLLFLKNYFQPQKPVLLKGLMKNSPAIEKWKDFHYFRQQHGRRTVPVEIGTSYTDEKWTQKLMTIQSFLDNYVENPSPSEVGYLAQHPIFDQIPLLSQDIIAPDYIYCDTSSNDDDDSKPIPMIWFGPKGTITPLHTDNYNNIFTQIVGKKYIRLYEPSDTQYINPFKKGPLTNTSQIREDLHNLSSERKQHLEKNFPSFLNRPYYEVFVEPGDGLYIPYKWWHFVKSLTPNISMSFWFG